MQSYKIGICDDDQGVRNILKDHTESFFGKLGCSYDIYEYSSGEELLARYDRSLDILLLDIILDDLNGIETAKEIRKTDEKVCIILISAVSDYAREGYYVKAFRYLHKPIHYENYQVEMTDAVSEVSKHKSKFITIRTRAGFHSINQLDIIFLEVKGRTIEIREINGSVITHDPLKRFEKELDKNCFFKCHQGFIVNLNFIGRITANNIIELKHEYRIPLSKHRKKEFMRQLTIFWRGKI